MVALPRYLAAFSFLLGGVTLALGQGDKPGASGGEEVAAKAAIVAYSANAQAFPFYKCRYRTTKAQARSVEDAVRGQYLNARDCDHRMLVDGDKVLYEGFAPPPDPKQKREVPGKKGVFLVPSPGPSDRYLDDGTREMNYVPTLQAANLFSADRKRRGIPGPTPGMGVVGRRNEWGPDALLARPERYEFSVVGPEEVSGRLVLTVRFNDKHRVRRPEGPLALAHTFSFDGSRGHLPIRMITFWNEKPKTLTFITDVQECSNQRWFPRRTVVVDTPDRPGGLCDVTEVKLLELDAEQRPAAGDFVVAIPGGTQVLRGDDDSSTAFFKLKQKEEIGLDDLPQLFTMVEQARSNPLMDTAVPHHGSRWGRYGLLAGLALLLGGAAFLIARRLANRRLA